MIPLVINAFHTDLNSGNELYQSMALASVGAIGGKEMAQALGPSIEKLLLSSTAKTLVRKKAALGLLKLYRRHNLVVHIESFPEKMKALFTSEKSVGLLTAASSLLLGIAEENPDLFRPVIPAVVNVLNSVKKTHLFFHSAAVTLKILTFGNKKKAVWTTIWQELQLLHCSFSMAPNQVDEVLKTL